MNLLDPSFRRLNRQERDHGGCATKITTTKQQKNNNNNNNNNNKNNNNYKNIFMINLLDPSFRRLNREERDHGGCATKITITKHQKNNNNNNNNKDNNNHKNNLMRETYSTHPSDV